jgi:ADP-heptose:LPS heptosyltransferase
MQHLNIPLQGSDLEFPVSKQDHLELQSLPESAALVASSYVCLHPGARYASRRWPAERYARVGDALVRDGYVVVLTGAASERELANQVSAAMAQPHINLAGRTSLGALGALLAGARLLVCNDTGVSHVASALQVPSVVVVTGSDVARWAPLDRHRYRLVMAPAECRPCEHRACPIDFHCATGISVEQVLSTAREMLGPVPPVDPCSIAEGTACAV